MAEISHCHGFLLYSCMYVRPLARNLVPFECDLEEQFSVVALCIVVCIISFPVSLQLVAIF